MKRFDVMNFDLHFQLAKIKIIKKTVEESYKVWKIVMMKNEIRLTLANIIFRNR